MKFILLFRECYDISKNKENITKKAVTNELTPEGLPDLCNEFYGEFMEPNNFFGIYEMEEIRFRGVSPLQMIADKTLAISSEVVFRRIKDIVDLYYISQVFEFTKEEILSIILKGGRSLGDFHGFLYKTDELQHAYEKYRFTGEVYKPDFDEIYNIVKKYIQDFLPG